MRLELYVDTMDFALLNKVSTFTFLTPCVWVQRVLVILGVVGTLNAVVDTWDSNQLFAGGPT